MEYEPIPLPTHIARKEKGSCIGNSVEAALEHGLRYAEGIAKSAEVGFWYRHAWNLDAEGSVIDTTWEVPGLRYIGREYLVDKVLEQAVDRGVYDYMNTNPNKFLVPDGEVGLDCWSAEQIEFFHSQGVEFNDHSG